MFAEFVLIIIVVMGVHLSVSNQIKVTVNSLAINAQIMQNAWVFSIVPVQSNMLANNHVTFCKPYS